MAKLTYNGFVKRILEVIDTAGIEYMVGGAVAVWAWGEPRGTRDFDVVVHINPSQVNKLSEELEKIEIYVPVEIILDNLIETRADLAINAIHGASGFKAEFFPLREGDELRKTALRRKVEVDFGDELGNVFVHSPEDLIIYKLIYFGLSKQTKHTRDIASIVAHLGDKLDHEYIEEWASRKGVNAIWREILGKN